MTPPAEKPWRAWLWVGIAMTVGKLWLTRGQAVFAIGPSDHDDLLFLRLADHLVKGEWLGPYDQLTLAKGPFYSLWIAAMFWIGVPLFLSQHVLYAGACALFTRACRPAICRASLRFLLYAFLLWNPMSFDASSMGRVLRQHVYGPLVLLMFAGLVALHLRRREPLRRLVPWAVLLGLAAAGFWLTREESLWMVPSVALLGGAGAFGAGRISRDALRTFARALLLAAACALLPVLLVCGMNSRHYRWFGTVEFRAAEFKDAYGAMVRVKIGPEIPFVPVTREAREAMYAVSPALAEVRPFLEGNIGRDWAGVSTSITKLPAEQLQIGGGWLTWALRDSTAAAGYGHDAKQALRFYGRMAGEINRACDAGRLPAGPARSGFLPRWREGQAAEVVRTAIDFGDFVASFRNFSASAPPSFGSEQELRLFRDLTREKLSPAVGGPAAAGPKDSLLNEWKTATLQQIGKAFSGILFSLCLLAHAVAAIRIVQSPWQQTWTFALTLAVAAWGACAASVLMHALIQVTSFPVLGISSFAPIYPLLLVFTAAALWDGGTAWRAARREARSALVQPDPVPEPVPPEAPRARLFTWLAGLAALAPFVIWHRQFAELFWFGDDYFLVDQIASMGFWSWTGRVFSENFVPVFKFLWGGSVLLFDGSYTALLGLMWVTHAVNTLCLGRLLARAGFPLVATLMVQIVFALSAANIETLGWSVQWSAVLAVMFLLLGLLWHETRVPGGSLWSWRRHGPLVLLAAASACSFSRGVLTGPVFALALVLPATLPANPGAWRRALPASMQCLLPSAAVAAVIALFAAGNHQHMSGHWAEAARFALGYFLLDPGQILFGGHIWHALTLVFLGMLKVGAVLGGFAVSTGRTRRILVLLLFFDLANAALLGIGRYHTGIDSVISSRYCYCSLLATLPFVGLLAARALQLLPGKFQLRTLGSVALLSGLAGVCLLGWPGKLDAFLVPRGQALRQLMQGPTTPAGVKVTVPALDFMHVERAKALIRAYHLH